MNSKRFFHNILILTAGSIVLRLIAIGFSGWLTRKVGAEGMGLYQLTFSVYSFASTIATSGIYLAVTRLVAEHLGRKEPQKAAAAMKVCFLYGAVISAAASAFLWFGAPVIGEKILRDPRTILPMKVLSAALPFMALSCSLRGYFFAVRQVWKTNTSQILEQLIRIATVAAAFFLFLPDGAEQLERACIGIAAGSVSGEALAFCYTFSLYLRAKSRVKKADSLRSQTRPVLSIAVPVAFSSYLKSALTTVENILIPRGFSRYGADRTLALSQYGMMEAMVMPVLSFPSALITSFSSLLIPEVAQWRAEGKYAEIDRLTGEALKATFFFALPVSAVFILFGEQIGSAVFGKPEAGRMLWVMAPLTPILYLDTVADALLKGLDEQLSVLRYSIIDSSLSVLLLYTLLPLFGMKGYISVLFFTSFVNASLSIGRLCRITKVTFSFTGWILRPLVSAAAASAAAYLLESHRISPGFQGLQTFSGILLMAAVYTLFLFLTGGKSKAVLRRTFFSAEKKRQVL